MAAVAGMVGVAVADTPWEAVDTRAASAATLGSAATPASAEAPEWVASVGTRTVSEGLLDLLAAR